MSSYTRVAGKKLHALIHTNDMCQFLHECKNEVCKLKKKVRMLVSTLIVLICFACCEDCCVHIFGGKPKEKLLFDTTIE